MSKFQKLAAINKIANDCIQEGDYVLASRFHQEFMKIAQDSALILRKEVAEGMGLDSGVLKEELLANVVRICDYIRPERLRNPSAPAGPNNVYLRSMAGATPKNSYADEYWQHCADSFNNLMSPTMISNFKSKCDFIRKAARAGDEKAVLSQFASEG